MCYSFTYSFKNIYWEPSLRKVLLLILELRAVTKQIRIPVPRELSFMEKKQHK